MNLIEKAHAAANWDIFAGITMPTATNQNTLSNAVTQIISVIFMIAGAAAIIYLIYSGILYITAAGNPDAAKKGQQGIINAVIGIVVIVLAYLIAGAVARYVSGTVKG